MFIGDKSKKTIRILVQFRPGSILRSDGAPLPIIRDGTIADLVLPASAIADESERRKLEEESTKELLQAGTPVFVGLNPTGVTSEDRDRLTLASKLRFDPEPEAVRIGVPQAPKTPVGRGYDCFAEVQLLEPLILRTRGEETKLRAAIQSDYPSELPAFDLALHTGMRQSEQYRLTWNCVDLESRQLTIPRSKHGGIRYIPLDNTALAALVALRSRSDGDGPVMVLAESGHGYKADHARKTPKEWFMACCQKAGIEDFTWHCLRHTFARRLVMGGVPLRTVQELMGHKTIAMTCRCAHLAPPSTNSKPWDI